MAPKTKKPKPRSIDTPEAMVEVLTGRTITAVEWHVGGDWNDEDCLSLALDDGNELTMWATGWHGSGGLICELAKLQGED
jgi:hypothetical protein